MITYKNIELADIHKFWIFLNQLDSETDCMMYEAGERSRRTTYSDLESEIRKHVIHDNDFLYIAVDHDTIVGYIRAEIGRFSRIRHSAYIVTGILRDYRSIGIGTVFFNQLDIWAKENKISRLELSVQCRNQAARHLYEKNGFKVEGLKKKSMYVNGQYIDEYYMAKLTG